MKRTILAAIICFLAGCDSSSNREVVTLGAAAAALDWDQVRTHTGGQETELLWGLLRELDVNIKADSGELVLFWGADDAIVSRDGAVRIERFWPRNGPEDQAVTPELWKSLVWSIGLHSGGRYQGKGLAAVWFEDGRGEASDTEWSLKAAEGANGEPALLVEWKTKWSPTLPGKQPGGP